MSWVANANVGEDPPLGPTADEIEGEKIADYSGRLVSTKTANKPFLAYTKYRQQKEEEHRAWLKRKAEREEKIARGEKVGPEELDPTAEVEIGLWGLIKFFAICVLVLALAGKFITGSFLWDYETNLPKLRSFLPTQDRLFSESTLAKFDGSDPNFPIYLAIDSVVYDVTEGRRTYGPGGSYHFMAGKDAARAFATGCFATHQTHDIRGLNEKELKGLEHWKDFFANHKKYKRVGKVAHHPIDPQSPIPEPCKAEKGAKNSDSSKPSSEPASRHEEL